MVQREEEKKYTKGQAVKALVATVTPLIDKVKEDKEKFRSCQRNLDIVSKELLKVKKEYKELELSKTGGGVESEKAPEELLEAMTRAFAETHFDDIKSELSPEEQEEIARLYLHHREN